MEIDDVSAVKFLSISNHTIEMLRTGTQSCKLVLFFSLTAVKAMNDCGAEAASNRPLAEVMLSVDNDIGVGKI